MEDDEMQQEDDMGPHGPYWRPASPTSSKRSWRRHGKRRLPSYEYLPDHTYLLGDGRFKGATWAIPGQVVVGRWATYGQGPPLRRLDFPRSGCHNFAEMHQERGGGSGNDQEAIDRPNGQQAVALVGDAARNHRRIDALLSRGVMVILLPSLETLDYLVAPGHVHGNAASLSDSATTVGNLLIDLTEHRVLMGQLELPISERELAILAALCQEPGRARTFAELATATPGDRAWLGDTELVHSAIKRLRRKLAKAGAEAIIESVRGYGFRLRSLRRPHSDSSATE